MDRDRFLGGRVGPARTWNKPGRPLAALTCATLLLLAAGAHAQPAPTLVPAGVALKADDLQTAMNQAQQDASLPTDIKAKVVDLYKQALDELHMADEWVAKGNGYKKAADDAPRMLDEIKAQLDQSAAEPAEKMLAESSLDKLKLGLTQAEVARNDLQTQQNELQAAVRRRADRVDEVRVLEAASKQRIDEIDRQLSSFVGGSENLPPLDRAQRRLLLARKAKTLAERGSYEQELPSYEATRELLRAKLDLATHRLNQAEKIEKSWQDWVARRSSEDAEAKARSARWAVITARPEVLPLAQKNERLAELRKSADGPVARLKAVQDEVAVIAAERQDLERQASHIKKIADLPDSMGLFLQQQREKLPDLRHHRKEIAARRDEIARVSLELFELETNRSDLADIDPDVAAEADPEVAAVMNAILATPSDIDRHELKSAVRELLETQRDYLDALIADYNNYFNALQLDLDKNQRDLIRETEKYSDYINERIFWVRNASPLGRDELARTWQALGWLGNTARWRDAAATLTTDLRKEPALYALASLVAVTMLLTQRRMRRRIQTIGQQITSNYTDTMQPTVEVLARSVLLAVLWPGVLCFVAWRLGSVWDAPEFAKEIGCALHVTAIMYLTTELFRQFWRRDGLAEAHFGWPQAGVALLRQNLRWLLIAGLPLTFLVALIQHHDGSPHDSSLGRLAFIAGLLCLALFAARALRPIDPTARNPLIQQRAKLVQRFHAYWYPVAVAIPLVLAGIAAWGYYYTALQLTWRLQATIWLVLGLLITHSFLLRCVLVGRRRLAIEHARQLREHAHAHIVHLHGHPEDGQAPHQEAHAAIETDADSNLDLSAIDAQNRRLLRTGCMVALVVGSWLIWVEVLPALKFLDQWQLWQSHETVAQAASADGQAAAATVMEPRWITVGDLVTAIVIVLLTIVGSRNLPGLLEIAFLRRLPLDAGGRYALTSVARYIITVVGLITACGSIGIGWENVQWLAAAMTVGLGFGLQEIFANFVSGLIILFERPVRVGDTVTICGISGTVTRIRARATTISDADRKELIVPNKEFITGQLVNWTLTDPVQRMVIKIGVAYGSDPGQVTQLLLKAAHDQPDVLQDPGPSACFVDFGNSNLDFELRMYLAGLDKFSKVRHNVNMAIDLLFREAGIEMAFPQQDIHIRTLPPSASQVDVPRLLAGGRDVEAPHSKSA